MKDRLVHAPLRATVIVMAGALALTSCSTSSPGGGTDTDTVSVVAAFYPFQFIAEQVGGDHVQVSNLTQPGSEPHDLELTAQQTASIGQADLVLYQTGFQSAVDEAVAQNTPKSALDAASIVTLQDPVGSTESTDEEDSDEDHDHGDHADHDHSHHADHFAKDPHQWLDPQNMITITNAVRDRLSELDTEHAERYASNATTLVEKLQQLDSDYSVLGSCQQKNFVTTHAAFGYLASRYGLNQISIAGLSPDEEPSPARIAAVQQLARDNGVTTIFYEALVSDKVASSIAGDLGLTTDVLDPLEGITDESRGNDYIEVMQSNLTALKTANQCG
ncbi:metal ABC transporter substrate-binding protein [Propionibacterium australiense]|uniref:Zinc ABC transporter substrate-binding protein n=1 Tax=Propionibacterium australiense TaxID=119981 RepID=A0A8B3FTF5_9ACTN|nr:metal ABC transporter substrate-binding protein [Propionibacterium australiense]RLP13106.1 zinc ABC transporter substrate-binding protein [Propionibacterium australiense]